MDSGKASSSPDSMSEDEISIEYELVNPSSGSESSPSHKSSQPPKKGKPRLPGQTCRICQRIVYGSNNTFVMHVISSHFPNKASTAMELYDKETKGNMFLCMICRQTSDSKRGFRIHLTFDHFLTFLTPRLPSVAPFKCPRKDCTVELPSIHDLVFHCGVDHDLVMIQYSKLTSKDKDTFKKREKEWEATDKERSNKENSEEGTSEEENDRIFSIGNAMKRQLKTKSSIKIIPPKTLPNKNKKPVQIKKEPVTDALTEVQSVQDLVKVKEEVVQQRSDESHTEEDQTKRVRHKSADNNESPSAKKTRQEFEHTFQIPPAPKIHLTDDIPKPVPPPDKPMTSRDPRIRKRDASQEKETEVVVQQATVVDVSNNNDVVAEYEETISGLTKELQKQQAELYVLMNQKKVAECLQRKVEMLEQERNDRERTYFQVKDVISKLQQTIQNRESQCQRSEEARRAAERESEGLRMKIREMQTTINARATSMDIREKEFETQERKMADLTSKLQEANKTSDKIRKIVNDYESVLKTKEKELKQSKVDHEKEMQKKTKTLQDKIHQLESKQRSYEVKEIGYKDSLADNKKRIDQLEAKVKELQEKKANISDDEIECLTGASSFPQVKIKLQRVDEPPAAEEDSTASKASSIVCGICEKEEAPRKGRFRHVWIGCKDCPHQYHTVCARGINKTIRGNQLKCSAVSLVCA